MLPLSFLAVFFYQSRQRSLGLGLGLLSLLPAPAGAQVRPAARPDSVVANVTQNDADRLEAAYLTLGSLAAGTRNVLDPTTVAEELPELNEDLHAIEHSAEENGQVLDIKRVQMCELMLANLQEQLTDWRTELGQARQQVATMQRRLRAVAPLPVLPAADSGAARTLAAANAALARKKLFVSQFLARKMQAVLRLQSQVSTSYIQALELQDQVNGQLRGFGRQTLRPDHPPLWAAAAPAAAVPPESAHQRAAERQVIAYYFASNWDNWLYMALLGLAFLGWVGRNYRRLPAETPGPAFRYLRPWPLAAAGVVMFSLAPALELRPPPVYLDVLQGLLLLALTGVFWRAWPRASFWSWLGLVGYFAALAVTNAGDGAGPGGRWGLLLLNALAPAIGWYLLARIRRQVGLPRLVVPVAFLFIGLNVLAAAANVLGRLSLAKLLSTAAIFGLTQGIGLAVLTQLLTEAFHLQILSSQGQAGGRGLDYAKIGASLLRLLSGLVGALWLLVFTANLALQQVLYGATAHFLSAPRRLGSTGFTYGNIGLFFLILYVSARVQQYIGYFFGEIGDDADSRQRGSWLVALRLLVVVVGFALATTASGLPLSKIAIVFGALSVGIGLGLQSIVNNLVSGIILIFERPFHVGDFIEVAGKAGRVQDIGIRASKLASPTGSEIIVPNGDLLSSHVINWTRTNDHIRMDLALKLAPGTDLEADLQTAREQIQEEIKASPYTMHTLPPEILLNDINGKDYELKVLFWVMNIRQQELTKSEILAGIYRRFTTHGLKLS